MNRRGFLAASVSLAVVRAPLPAWAGAVTEWVDGREDLSPDARSRFVLALRDDLGDSARRAQQAIKALQLRLEVRT